MSDLAVLYRRLLAEDAGQVTWKQANDHAKRLRHGMRMSCQALAALPSAIAFCELEQEAAAVVPGLEYLPGIERLAKRLQARLVLHADTYTRGGPRRLRRGPTPIWRLAVAAAAQLDQERGHVTSAELIRVVRAAVAPDNPRGLVTACRTVASLWRDRDRGEIARARLEMGM